jgi:hypothetical protein
VVPEPHQVDQIHYLAQLQVDHFENHWLAHADNFPYSLLLFLTRLHHQAHVRGLRIFYGDDLKKYTERREMIY